MTDQSARTPAVHELTVKEYAQHERVTTRTVWTWISKGAVPVRRTPGGSVRVQLPRRHGASAR